MTSPTPTAEEKVGEPRSAIDLAELKRLLEETTANHSEAAIAGRDAARRKIVALVPALIARLEQAEAGWQPIETAPRDGTKLWVYQHGREQFVAWWAESLHDDGEYWHDEADDEPEPTHWMLLPTPPEGTGEMTDVERCIACAQPMVTGQRYYHDVSGGVLHAECLGPERECYVNLDTGEPIAPGDPIPAPAIW